MSHQGSKSLPTMISPPTLSLLLLLRMLPCILSLSLPVPVVGLSAFTTIFLHISAVSMSMSIMSMSMSMSSASTSFAYAFVPAPTPGRLIVHSKPAHALADGNRNHRSRLRLPFLSISSSLPFSPSPCPRHHHRLYLYQHQYLYHQALVSTQLRAVLKTKDESNCRTKHDRDSDIETGTGTGTEIETETEIVCDEHYDYNCRGNEQISPPPLPPKSMTKTQTKTQMQLIGFQNYIRDAGILRFVVNAITRTVLAPLFYIENPHLFPQFIRISEYPHWLAILSQKLLDFALDDDDNNKRGKRSIGVRENDNSVKTNNIDADPLQPYISFHKEAYGTHPSQRADVMVKEELKSPSNPSSQLPPPLFIFLHGGAWGSGFPTMYRLISLPFLERNFRAVVLGYRTYPEGTMEDQIQDLVRAVEYFTDKYAYAHANVNSNTNNDCANNDTSAKSKVILMGHSSGSHIAMMAALRGHLIGRVDGLIGMSGVYDLEEARERELQQDMKTEIDKDVDIDADVGAENSMVSISELSPMLPACRGRSLKEYSPSWLAMERSKLNQGLDSGSVLDASRASTITSTTTIASTELLPILLLHGADDTVAPPLCSEKFYHVMKRGKSDSLDLAPCRLEILEGLQHQDLVLETCIGRGKTQSIIFDWIENHFGEFGG